MFALTGGMPDSKDDDFLSLFVGCVIHQIRIAPRHQLAHTLGLLLPSDMWKQIRF